MRQFDHEKLNVYQSAVGFVAWSSELLETIPQGMAVHNQIDRGSTPIPLNMAEANGKYTPADRCRYFDIPRGSALEYAACLDVPVVKKKIPETVASQGKSQLAEIVSMLIGLIRAHSETQKA